MSRHHSYNKPEHQTATRNCCHKDFMTIIIQALTTWHDIAWCATVLYALKKWGSFLSKRTKKKLTKRIEGTKTKADNMRNPRNSYRDYKMQYIVLHTVILRGIHWKKTFSRQSIRCKCSLIFVYRLIYVYTHWFHKSLTVVQPDMLYYSVTERVYDRRIFK